MPPADEKTLIVGTWKLVSVMYEDQETKALTPVFGDRPRGCQIATADGRWLALATPSERPVPTTDQERAQAFQRMIAYSGRYRVDDSTGIYSSLDLGHRLTVPGAASPQSR